MSVKRSQIGWTDYSGGDANFVLRGKAHGDCEVSPGCAHCYAQRLRVRQGEGVADQTTFDRSKLKRLVRARFEPGGELFRRGPDSRPMVFVVDMGDLFHPNVPDDLIAEAVNIFAARSDVDWQILTKRVDRMVALLGGVGLPPNTWWGATVENQKAADERVRLLRQLHASVLFLSVEPMLERIQVDLAGISWVISGGESGGDRRPFEKAWARDLMRQCRAAGVPFFGKQDSGLRPGTPLILDGQEIKEWPR